MSDEQWSQRVKLGSFTPTIHRDCWVTLWHNAELNIDCVIGAGTKEACSRLFESLSLSRCNDDLIYAATVVATKDGIQPFRALAPLAEPMLCTCLVGVRSPTDYCKLHGGRLCA